MRARDTIIAEIEATERRLLALRDELADSRQAEIDGVLRRVAAGFKYKDVGKPFGMSASAVAGIVMRHGRAAGGRTDIHDGLHAMAVEGERA